jgi:hypothetical protein
MPVAFANKEFTGGWSMIKLEMYGYLIFRHLDVVTLSQNWDTLFRRTNTDIEVELGLFFRDSAVFLFGVDTAAWYDCISAEPLRNSRCWTTNSVVPDI